MIAFEANEPPIFVQAGHEPLNHLPAVRAAIHIVAKCDERGG
jgi:hypothetical protein